MAPPSIAPIKRDGANTPPELPEPRVNDVASGFRKIRREESRNWCSHAEPAQ